MNSLFRIAAFTACFAIAGPAVASPEPSAKAAANYQDLWWGGEAETGWGMNITQHGDTLFTTLFVYDRAGNPVWIVMPGGHWTTATEYVGDLYTPYGSPFYAYDAKRLDVRPAIGSMGMRFVSDSTAQLVITIYGETTTRTVTRQPFGDGPAVGNLTDLWWGGAAQNGWGLALTQHGGSLFGVWYTYDSAGYPTWFVMPGGAFHASGSAFTGRIYETSGPQWWGIPFDGARVTTRTAGELRLVFTGPGTATLDWTHGELRGRQAIERQPF